MRVMRGGAVLAARGRAVLPDGPGVRRLTATAVLLAGQGGPSWSVAVVCPATGVIVHEHDVALDGRIGRALGQLARLLEAAGGGN